MTKFPRYNDGVCYVVEDQTAPSSFAAKRNGLNASDYKAIFRLMFAEMSIREQDLEFAEANSRTLNRKIKTPRVKGWNAQNKIIIENTLYDIVNADIDRVKNEIYFYLEEVRELVNA
jgi:SPP1 family predicted phage head-tail adaptor